MLLRNYHKVMNVLSKLRKELGITQIEAARLLNISRRTYQTYEQKNCSLTYRKLLTIAQLDEVEYVLSIKTIKQRVKSVFKKYNEVSAAYLYGSYARNEAKPTSDIDILVVCPATGLRFYKMAADLEDILKKKVDLQTHRQLANNENLLEMFLQEGIKIY